jgi:hypothetical protein
MPAELRQKIAAVNTRLTGLVQHTRRSLRGETQFGVEQVRALAAPIAEMAPIMARAKALEDQQPEIAGELAQYKSQLAELHIALQQVTMMLLARRGQMESGRIQLDAVTKWANTLGQTR